MKSRPVRANEVIRETGQRLIFKQQRAREWAERPLEVRGHIHDKNRVDAVPLQRRETIEARRVNPDRLCELPTDELLHLLLEVRVDVVGCRDDGRSH